jgi:alkyl hydroperoxide reductase subunit D
MSLESLANRLPNAARDIKQNLATVTGSTVLNPQQLWGTLLASALAARSDKTIEAVAAEATPNLSAAALEAVKTAHALMAMNNIYYHAVHLIHDETLNKMPARLRMTAAGNPGVDKVDFELWALAVSAINACDMCLKAHVKGILAAGGSMEQIQEALRVAAIVHSVAATLDGEGHLITGAG